MNTINISDDLYLSPNQNATILATENYMNYNYSYGKVLNSFQSTSFYKLKNNEKKYGFSEAILSKKTNEKIPFFFLGPDNDWKKILTEDMKTRLNQIYEKNLKELSYI